MMADSLVKKAYAQLANGPLVKPSGMYRPRLEAIRKASVPTAVVCYGVLGLMYVSAFEITSNVFFTFECFATFLYFSVWTLLQTCSENKQLLQ